MGKGPAPSATSMTQHDLVLDLRAKLLQALNPHPGASWRLATVGLAKQAWLKKHPGAGCSDGGYDELASGWCSRTPFSARVRTENRIHDSS